AGMISGSALGWAMEVVSMKNVMRRKPRSTMGVMSTRIERLEARRRSLRLLPGEEMISAIGIGFEGEEIPAAGSKPAAVITHTVLFCSIDSRMHAAVNSIKKAGAVGACFRMCMKGDL